MNKEELENKVNENMSVREISKFFNTSFSSVQYYLKKYKLKTKWYKKNLTWDFENVKKIISNAYSRSDILRKLNIKTISGNFQTLDRFIRKHSIDTSHLSYNNSHGTNWGFQKKILNEGLFIENSLSDSNTVKRRIIKEELKEYKCESCLNIGCWNGETLTLQLDHINGINNDHRLENLRFLCPNCHSQTKTYGSRNLKTSKEKLEQDRSITSLKSN